jgi:choline-sulfatase
MIGALAVAAAATVAPNLVVVTIDTLRADHVGAYGYALADTKTLDRLAREGALLEDAVVQVPQTRPSHASIFTGRYPYEHGLRDNHSPPLPASIPTLASVLRKKGYATAAFVGAYPVSRGSGLDQGFALYDDPFGEGEHSTTDEARLERSAAAVVEAAVRWLERRSPGPFFAWVHLFDPHSPYAPPAPWDRRFSKSLYDGEVAYADAQLARLVEWLDRSGLRGDTLLVVTSDHGEGLGDHGEHEHLLLLYDSTLKVPALLSWPGRLPAGARVRGQFRSIDFFPTLLELLGIEAPPSSGISRAEALRRSSRIPDSESYAESLYGQLHFGWAPLRALRGEGFKLIEAPRPELYRVYDDPKEQTNLMGLRPQVAAAMRARLASYDKTGGPESAGMAVDPAALERLAALGYVGGSFFVGTPSGEDPKDKIAWYETQRRNVSRAIRLYRDGKVDAALPLLERLARPERNAAGQLVTPRSFNVSYTLGRALIDKRRYADAVPYLQQAIEAAPTATPAYVYLAQALAGARRSGEAVAVLDRALARAPANPELLRAKGGLQLRGGDLGSARVTLERAREGNPKDVLTLVDLSAVYRNSGDLARAREAAAEGARLQPHSAAARVALGLVQGAAGNEAEAADALREALRLEEDNPDALFYLAAIHLRAGRPAEARPLLDHLLLRAPDYPGARAAFEAAGGEAAASGHTPAGVAPRVTKPSDSGKAADDTLHLQILRVREKTLAEDLARRIVGGADFGALAREHSLDASAVAGGDLGRVNLRDLAEPVRSATARLAAGEMTPPLDTGSGWVLIRRLPR